MQTNRAKHLDFIILDILSLVISFWFAYIIRMQKSDILHDNEYVTLSTLIVAAYLVIILMKPYHSGIIRRNVYKEIRAVLEVNTIIMALIFAYLFVFKTTEVYSRIVVVVFYVIDNVIMLLGHVALKAYLRKKYTYDENRTKALIVTYRKHLDSLIEAVKSSGKGFFRIEGAVLLDRDRDPNDQKRDMDIIYREDILEYFKKNVVDDVYIRAKREEVSELTNTFISMGVNVHLTLNVFVDELPNATLSNVGKYSMITTSINRITIGQMIIKRAFDIVVSIIGLVFTGLFTLILAPVIKIQAPGPVFFSQVRVGKNGRKFKMYKFRSMYIDAEERKKELMAHNEMQGLMFKMENDPRIFPAGNFIRKTSIDEFPQFLNILKGDMSLVGTRPPTVDEFEQYHRHHLSRLAMKPGLTGMWQVSGRSDITDFEEVVRLDNEYIKNFTLGLDIKIIIKTFKAVLKAKGSK